MIHCKVELTMCGNPAESGFLCWFFKAIFSLQPLSGGQHLLSRKKRTQFGVFTTVSALGLRESDRLDLTEDKRAFSRTFRDGLWFFKDSFIDHLLPPPSSFVCKMQTPAETDSSIQLLQCNPTLMSASSPCTRLHFPYREKIFRN